MFCFLTIFQAISYSWVYGMPTMKTAWTKNKMTRDKENLAGAEGKGGLVAFQRPHLQAQGFDGAHSSPLNRTYWLEEKPDLSMFGEKNQDLHPLLSQRSRTPAATEGPADMSEKSTRSRARNPPLWALHFFPLLQKVAHIFSLKQLSLSRKEPAVMSLGGISYTHVKAQKLQEGAVMRSIANGWPGFRSLGWRTCRAGALTHPTEADYVNPAQIPKSI